MQGNERIKHLDPSLGMAHLIKKIQVNFDELYVAAIANRIIVYEARQLKPIDVSGRFQP